MNFYYRGVFSTIRKKKLKNTTNTIIQHTKSDKLSSTNTIIYYQNVDGLRTKLSEH